VRRSDRRFGDVPKLRSGLDGADALEILCAIWKETRALDGRSDQTNERLDAARVGSSGEIDRLRREVTESAHGLRRRSEEHVGIGQAR
jgi:hypothetical protein